MGFIVGFLVAVAFIGALLYVLVIHREVPGAVEQRFGVLEALPEDVGKWKIDEESAEGKEAASKGLKRETRIFHDQNASGMLSSGKLIRQVRYRNRATNAVVRVDPDETIKRKRVRS